MVSSITAAHNVEAHHGTFNDVGQNQYNYNIQIAPLRSALSTAAIISSIVQQAESSREQLQVLGASINTLLSTLRAEYFAGRLLENNNSDALKNLNSYVNPVNLGRSSHQNSNLPIDCLMTSAHLSRRKLQLNS